MNNLIIALVFLFGAGSLQAAPYVVDDHIAQSLAEASVASVKKVIKKQVASEDKGVDYFKTIMKTSPLYSMLLTLETELPQITKTLEFIGMFNEVHELNQQLAFLVKQMQQNNALTERQNIPA